MSAKRRVVRVTIVVRWAIVERSLLAFVGVLAAGCVANDGASFDRGARGGTTPRDASRPSVHVRGAPTRDAARGDASSGEGSLRDATANPSDAPDQRAPTAPPLVNIVTQHNDTFRTGANLAETTLTVDSVGGGRFRKLFVRAVDDQVYAQPLLVSGLAIPGRGVLNVLFVVTVNDTIYAFDADDPTASAPLWSRSLLGPGVVPPRNADMTGACNGNYQDFSGNIGIVSTPVIDPATRTMYLVARTHEGAAFVQKIHAVDLTDGTERAGSPVTISASVAGTGDGTTTVAFDPLHENQRAALLLSNGVVYVSWAAHCDWPPYHGWIIGYDAATLAQRVVYNTTPNGSEGGVWQSGQGPASDGTDVFVITGNGSVGDQGDPRSLVGRGESFLKLRPNGGTFKVESFFTPHDYVRLEAADLDLGSAGILLVPGTRIGVGGGKAGILFVVDLDDMGGLTDSTSTDDNVLQTFPVSAPFRIGGSPVFWNGPDGGRVYVWGDTDQLKAFPFLGASYSPGATILDVAHTMSSSVTSLPSMPGAMLSISANGRARGSGVIWASHSRDGSANQDVRAGMFRAFDAETLTELWNSQETPARDDCGKFAKYAYPTIANGKVYLPSFSNQVCVYGLGD